MKTNNNSGWLSQYDEGGNIPSIVPVDAFKTFDFASLEGTPQTKEKNDTIHKTIIHAPDIPMAGQGESFNEAYNRVIPSIREIVQTAPNNTTIITHNSVFGLIKQASKKDFPDEFTQEERKAYTLQDGKHKTGDFFSIDGPNGKINIVRHGLTSDNVNGNFRSANTELTPKGIKQAKSVGEQLANVKIPLIISSPLDRAMNTADIIASQQDNDKKKEEASNGWLSKYSNGGLQEHQENYNDSNVSLPKGYVGIGNDISGRNYSPSWGGQFQDGGKISQEEIDFANRNKQYISPSSNSTFEARQLNRDINRDVDISNFITDMGTGAITMGTQFRYPTQEELQQGRGSWDDRIPLLASGIIEGLKNEMLGAGVAKGAQILGKGIKSLSSITKQKLLDTYYAKAPWTFHPEIEAYYHRSPDLKNVINNESGNLQGFGSSKAGQEYSNSQYNTFLKKSDGTPSTLRLGKSANNDLFFSKGTPLDYGKYNNELVGTTSRQGYAGPYLVEAKNIPMEAATQAKRLGYEPTKTGAYAVAKRPINKNEVNYYKENWFSGYKKINPQFQNGGGIKSFIKDRLANNIQPLTYDNPVERVFNAVVLNKKEPTPWIGEERMKSSRDAFNLYLGKPQENNSFTPSEFKPSISKNENQQYYKLNNLDEYVSEIAKKGTLNTGISLNPQYIPDNQITSDYQYLKNNNGYLVDTALGTWKLDQGNDEKGKYLSYYDSWNLNPYKGEWIEKSKIGKLMNKIVGDKEDISGGIGKPFDIYNRIYYEENPKYDEQYNIWRKEMDSILTRQDSIQNLKWVDEDEKVMNQLMNKRDSLRLDNAIKQDKHINLTPSKNIIVPPRNAGNYVPNKLPTNKSYNFNSSLIPKQEMGGNLPGAVGFSYARTGDIPSNGPYAKKTLASAQNGTEMKFYQEGNDFIPKSISKEGSEIKKLKQLIDFSIGGESNNKWLSQYK